MACGCCWTTCAGVAAAVLGAVWLVSKLLQPPRFDAKGKVVLITGGSSGIGLAAAKVRRVLALPWLPSA